MVQTQGEQEWWLPGIPDVDITGSPNSSSF